MQINDTKCSGEKYAPFAKKRKMFNRETFTKRIFFRHAMRNVRYKSQLKVSKNKSSLMIRPKILQTFLFTFKKGVFFIKCKAKSKAPYYVPFRPEFRPNVRAQSRRSKLLISKVLLNDTKPLLIVNHNKSPFLAFVFKL